MLVTFLVIWNKHLLFFHSMGNFPLSKQDWKINLRGLQIEVSHILVIQILIISCPWDLFGLRFLILFRISSVGKSIVDKDSCVFSVRITGSSLLLLTIEYWLAKKLLKILASSLKSVTDLSWCSSGGMQGIFLPFRKVFNIDQYDFLLVLGSNSLWDKRV